jgi:aspartate aminotransferase-like enzyme
VFSEAIASPTILALETPRGVQSKQVVDYLRDEHGILIASGMGEYKERTIRIGNMGVQASREQMASVIAGLGAMKRD